MAPSPGGKSHPRRGVAVVVWTAWHGLRFVAVVQVVRSVREPPAEMISSVKSAASAQFEKQSSNGIITACATATHDD